MAHAACVGQQGDDLAELEERAFRDPAKALPELANTISSSADMPPTRRAALHAIAAEAARQLGFSRQSITHADAGLALLPAGDMSDLAVRMRTVRAVVSTNVGGIDAATVELTRVIDAIRDRPLALGCVLRDRGWLQFPRWQSRPGARRSAALVLVAAPACEPRRSHGGGGPPVDGAVQRARLSAGAVAGR